MKVWIIQTAEPIHIDEPGMRPMRAMNLADALVDSGHEVCIWTTGFLHSTKKHRTKKYVLKKINPNLSIALIPSIGYKKNLGIRRVIDHIQLALNLRKRIMKNTKPVCIRGHTTSFHRFDIILFCHLEGNSLGFDSEADSS